MTRHFETAPRPARTAALRLISALLLSLTVGIPALAQSGHPAIPYEELPRLGEPDAPVRVVEFADFKCSHCKTFTDAVFPLLKREFIDLGTVAFYYMHYPVVAGDSITAAEAAAAVHDRFGNDAFWQFQKALFEEQGDPAESWASPEFLANLAEENLEQVDEAGRAELQQSLEEREYLDVVRRNYAIGREIGVQGTPTLVIGDTLVRDYRQYQRIRSLIDAKR